MNKKLLLNLIKKAQVNLVEYPQNYAHEITHHYRTWLNAKEIMLDVYEPFNVDLVELICWWHDVKVPNLDYNNKNIAQVTAEYLAKKVSDEDKDIVYDSIKNHEFLSSPQYIEGKILQDADKLEILSAERFRKVIDAIKCGLMDKDSFYKASVNIYNEWLPKMPKMYNFDISREMHAARLKDLDSKIKQNLEELSKI